MDQSIGNTPQINLQIQCHPYKNGSLSYFAEIDKMILSSHGNAKEPKEPKEPWKRRTQLEDSHLPTCFIFQVDFPSSQSAGSGLLDSCFFQWDRHSPCRSSRTFQEGSHTTKRWSPLPPCWHLHQWRRTSGGQNCWRFRRHQGSGPSPPGSHGALHLCPLTVKRGSFTEDWPWGSSKNDSFCDEVGSKHSPCPAPVVGWRKSTSEVVKVASWTSQFFWKHCFYLKEQLTGGWLGIWQTFPWKWKQLIVFVANGKIRALEPKLEFWKACIRHVSLTAFSIKTFLIRLVVILHVVSWHFVIKCVNVLKSSITQWTNIFQVNSVWGYEITSGKRPICNSRKANGF